MGLKIRTIRRWLFLHPGHVLLSLVESIKEILKLLPFLWVSFKNQPTYAVWESGIC